MYLKKDIYLISLPLMPTSKSPVRIPKAPMGARKRLALLARFVWEIRIKIDDVAKK